jgi:hypothetical protein
MDSGAEKKTAWLEATTNGTCTQAMAKEASCLATGKNWVDNGKGKFKCVNDKRAAKFDIRQAQSLGFSKCMDMVTSAAQAGDVGNVKELEKECAKSTKKIQSVTLNDQQRFACLEIIKKIEAKGKTDNSPLDEDELRELTNARCFLY